jgi:hypothetical protein
VIAVYAEFWMSRWSIPSSESAGSTEYLESNVSIIF